MATIFISRQLENVNDALVNKLKGNVEQASNGHVKWLDTQNAVKAGDDYFDAIEEAIEKVDLLLVLITPQWLGSWLEDEENHEAIAIKAALTSKKRVIPVLINSAAMPKTQQLPAEFASLARRQPLHITAETEQTDLTVLAHTLAEFLGNDNAEKAPQPPAAPNPTRTPDTVLLTPTPAQTPPPVTHPPEPTRPDIPYISAYIRRGNTSLRDIPDLDGASKLHINTGEEVWLLARNNQSDWVNVAYERFTGEIVLGWLRTTDIDKINFNGKPSHIGEVLLTDYKLNTSQELKKLHAIMHAQYTKAINQGCAAYIIVFFVAIILMFVGLTTSTGILIWLGGLVGLGAYIIGLIVYTRNVAQFKPYLKEVNLIKELAKTDQDRMWETQLKQVLMGTAVNVAGQAITRYVPNRQDVTVRHR